MARPGADGNIVCTGCNRSLPGTVKYFHRHRDAFKPRCKECRGSEFGVHKPNQVMDTPDGKKICTSCQQVLPADPEHFYRQQKTSDGFATTCKKCHPSDGRAEYEIHRPNKTGVTPDGREIPEGEWFCPSCEQIIPLNGRHFYEQDGGFEVYCKPCSGLRRNQMRRADTGLSGSDWESIKDHWRVDAVVHCAYCGDGTDSPVRDHVQPLANGGETVVENIIPTCESCNKSKHDSPATDWYIGSEIYDPIRWEKITSHINGSKPTPR
ncbi:hypothetical protein DJ84_18425 [Halorubrum ezzemoulense]|nr:hypothetical protein DJ84_18425 [Halorubrum ezzemoulense]